MESTVSLFISVLFICRFANRSESQELLKFSGRNTIRLCTYVSRNSVNHKCTNFYMMFEGMQT